MKKILLILMVTLFISNLNAQKKQECAIKCQDGSECFSSSNTANCRCGIFGAECISNFILPNDVNYYAKLKEKFTELKFEKKQVEKLDLLIKIILDKNDTTKKKLVKNFLNVRNELSSYLQKVEKSKLVEIENFVKDYELIKTNKFNINSLKYNIKEDIFEFENDEELQNTLKLLTREVLLNIITFSNKKTNSNKKNIDVDSLIIVEKFDYLVSLKNIENNFKFNSYRKINEEIFNKPISDEKELENIIPYNPILNTLMNRLGLVKISGKLVDFTFKKNNLDKSNNCEKSFISSNNLVINKNLRMYSRLKMTPWSSFGGDLYAHNEMYSKSCFFGFCGWYYNPFKTLSSKSKILDGKTYKCNCESTENFNEWYFGLYMVYKPFLYDIFIKFFEPTKFIKSEHKYDQSIQILTNP